MDQNGNRIHTTPRHALGVLDQALSAPSVRNLIPGFQIWLIPLHKINTLSASLISRMSWPWFVTLHVYKCR